MSFSYIRAKGRKKLIDMNFVYPKIDIEYSEGSNEQAKVVQIVV